MVIISYYTHYPVRMAALCDSICVISRHDADVCKRHDRQRHDKYDGEHAQIVKDVLPFLRVLLNAPVGLSAHANQFVHLKHNTSLAVNLGLHLCVPPNNS